MKQTSDLRVNLSLYVMDAELVRKALVNSFPLGWLRTPKEDDDDRRNTRRLIETIEDRIDRAKRRIAERRNR